MTKWFFQLTKNERKQSTNTQRDCIIVKATLRTNLGIDWTYQEIHELTEEKKTSSTNTVLNEHFHSHLQYCTIIHDREWLTVLILLLNVKKIQSVEKLEGFWALNSSYQYAWLSTDLQPTNLWIITFTYKGAFVCKMWFACMHFIDKYVNKS